MAPGPSKPLLFQCQSPGSPMQVGNVWREGSTCTSLISSWRTLFILVAINRLKLAFRQFKFVIFFPEVCHGKCLEVFSPKAAAKHY